MAELVVRGADAPVMVTQVVKAQNEVSFKWCEMKTLLCNDYQVVTKSVFSVVLCKLCLGSGLCSLGGAPALEPF